MRRLLSTALAVVVLTACGGGDSGPPLLSVQVVDDVGLPIIETRVRVTDAEPGAEIARALTDEEGWARVALREAGDYVIDFFHLVDDPPCFWDIGETEVEVGTAGLEVSLEGIRVCT